MLWFMVILTLNFSCMKADGSEKNLEESLFLTAKNFDIKSLPESHPGTTRLSGFNKDDAKGAVEKIRSQSRLFLTTE